MRLVSFEHAGALQAGVIDGDAVVPIEGATGLDGALLASGPDERRLRRGAALPLDEVRLRTPVPRPGKVICVGLNFRGHVHETGRELPTYPVLFTKFPRALIGPHEPIALPSESAQVDYEGELAVVIGREVRRIAPDRALEAVAGYAVANDVTMRDYQYKSHQWLQGKAWDRSTPVGPVLVTPDEAGDPAGLSLELRLNGEVMQRASLDRLIFDVPELISVVSEFTTLEPGDILLTGTPEGVGFRRDPQVFLAAGDVVSVDIPGLGQIENAVVDDDDARLGDAGDRQATSTIDEGTDMGQTTGTPT